MHDANGTEDVLEHISRLALARRAALAALARKEGVSPEDAIDCVQEALCKLLVAAQDGSLPVEDEDWAAILGGMVRNAARNRRRRHFLARPHDDLDAHPLDAGEGVAADEALVRAEEHVRLRACVEELCEIQKAVVTLRMLEEQPGEDVAHALGITPGYVAVLLHRAKMALRVCMTGRDAGAS
ncbi:RNA polymerase sigma factor [Polyangium mundeleinium]|uniref:Sigma-70 family RNA polymerase sigma factor n=1 Tax=Polyangium mundeleinium TaxID=2995306 RepID=A0ABT5EFS4_9BACT|nr:sigma-70 family RNA polymerase sigma factor [Polyangium mundeleinium]MDC0740668.1 sigma-70 family RNA polymerase sigma factor [Polyangium mundeleinium]